MEMDILALQAEMDAIDTEIGHIIAQAEEAFARILHVPITVYPEANTHLAGGSLWLHKINGRMRLGYTRGDVFKAASEWDRTTRANIASMLIFIAREVRTSLAKQLEERHQRAALARTGLSLIQEMAESDDEIEENG